MTPLRCTSKSTMRTAATRTETSRAARRPARNPTRRHGSAARARMAVATHHKLPFGPDALRLPNYFYANSKSTTKPQLSSPQTHIAIPRLASIWCSNQNAKAVARLDNQQPNTWYPACSWLQSLQSHALRFYYWLAYKQNCITCCRNYQI